MYGIGFLLLLLSFAILFVFTMVKNKVPADGLNIFLFMVLFIIFLWAGAEQTRHAQVEYHKGNVLIEENIKNHYVEDELVESDTTYTLKKHR